MRILREMRADAGKSWLSDVFPLTLGTAQLGMPYGRVVHTNPPDEQAAHALFDAAVALGVNCFDTARIYQRAEALIGSWAANSDRAHGKSRTLPAIVSKTHPLPDVSDEHIAGYLRSNLEMTLSGLGVTRLDGYLVHNADDLRRPGVAAFLAQLKADGRARATGISLYRPEQLAAAFRTAEPVVDFVQAPISVFDRRLLESPVIERCISASIAVFARSIFLQGVLFVEPSRLPPHLHLLSGPLGRLRGLAADAGRSLTALSVGAVLSGTPVSSVVVGIGSIEQLDAAVDAVLRPVPSDLAREAVRICRGLPDDVLDPRRWPALGPELT
jgi:aryl-alcohol dehydrogenase-like predicted oxidoreductase